MPQPAGKTPPLVAPPTAWSDIEDHGKSITEPHEWEEGREEKQRQRTRRPNPTLHRRTLAMHPCGQGKRVRGKLTRISNMGRLGYD